MTPQVMGMFYDVHAHSTLSFGEDSPESMAQFAQRLGFSGIGIVRYHDAIAAVPRFSGIEIIDAVMIKPADAQDVGRLAAAVRNNCDFLMVHGGDFNVNRAACENPMIDVLCHPELGRKDSGLDHVCIKAAADNKVAIEVNFREVIESYRKKRIHVFASMKKNVRLARKYGAPVITTSGAVSRYGLRSGRELAAMAHLLGLELGAAIDSLSSFPAELLRTNREKRAHRRWEGVHISG